MKKWDEFFGPLRIRLELMKENSGYRKLFKESTRQTFAENCGRFGIDLDRVPADRYTIDEVFEYLDPAVEGSGIGYDGLCRELFFDSGIRHPSVLRYEIKDGQMRLPVGKPSERLLIADLSRKDEDLLKAFKAILRNRRQDLSFAAEAAQLGESYPNAENFAQWKIDASRNRTEKDWQHLQVWKLRRQRKGFGEIARTLQMEVATAKMSFYRAYELIEGRSYDREKYKLEHWNLRECVTCQEHPDRGGTCKELCPDMEAFAAGSSVSSATFENIDQIQAAHSNNEWLTREARELQTKEDEQD